MYDLFDEASASSTVWVLKESSQGAWGFFDFDATSGAFAERPAVFGAHTRIWAEVIAGEPMRGHYDASALAFDLDFEGRGDVAPHVIRVPAALGTNVQASCDGASVTSNRDAIGRVSVVCAGTGMHTLHVSVH
jgi:hypothetical protein